MTKVKSFIQEITFTKTQATKAVQKTRRIAANFQEELLLQLFLKYNLTLESFSLAKETKQIYLHISFQTLEELH